MLAPVEANDAQGNDTWRQARAGSVTGTGFQSVLKYLKNGSPSKERTDYRLKLVVERITGIAAPEMLRVPALEWGKANEPEARIAYEMHSENFVECVGFQPHKTLDWVGTSPDGLVGESGMIEIKCPYDSANHLLTIINASKALAGALLGAKDAPLVAIPEEYVPQVQGNLWVLEREWCDFVSFDPRMPEHLRLYVARVYRDEPFIKRLEVETLKFLDEIEANVELLLFQEDQFPAPRQDVAQQPVERIAA